ncbi:MAG: hypothetical protein Q8P67_15970, partial [archaeon]|nr:hypothetical protein [archaeon]
SSPSSSVKVFRSKTSKTLPKEALSASPTAASAPAAVAEKRPEETDARVLLARIAELEWQTEQLVKENEQLIHDNSVITEFIKTVLIPGFDKSRLSLPVTPPSSSLA